MKNEFNIDELLLIRDLVEEEIAKRKELGDYEYYTIIKATLESTLEKVNDDINKIVEAR